MFDCKGQNLFRVVNDSFHIIDFEQITFLEWRNSTFEENFIRVDISDSREDGLI